MKPADDIKKFFRNARLSTYPDAHERVFQDVLDAHRQSTENSPAKPEIWRFAMRHPINKYAIAAVFILAAIAAFSLFHRTGGVSWAIEQSVEALGRYTAVVAEGSCSDRAWDENGSLELQPLKMWAVADADQTRIEKYRWDRNGVTMLVTDGHRTWKYEPQAQRLTICDGPYVASELWAGRGFLEQLKRARDEGILTHWEEAFVKDPATERRQVLLSVAWLEKRWNGPRSARLTFDLESKLLVGMKQWENAEWAGSPSIIIEEVTYYDDLSDDLFEFTIPEGATVVEE